MSMNDRLYSKTCVKQRLSKRLKIGFQDQLSLNGGETYCRMLQGEHSVILLTFIKLPFVINVICTYYYLFVSLFYISDICSEGHMVDWPSS